jgi:hypothetical protein
MMLREAGIVARDQDFFLFGSQALRAVCARYPKEFPITLEADLIRRANELAAEVHTGLHRSQKSK